MGKTKTPKHTPIPSSLHGFIHHHVGKLNNSKLFAGVVMILLNVGTKLIPIQISKSAEEYMKNSMSKHLLVFSMAWMGTRDIYTALILMGLFIVLSEYMFNDESALCIVPHRYKSVVISESIKNGSDASRKLVNQNDITNVIKMLEDLKNKV
jgi:hypothetical protein